MPEATYIVNAVDSSPGSTTMACRQSASASSHLQRSQKAVTRNWKSRDGTDAARCEGSLATSCRKVRHCSACSRSSPLAKACWLFTKARVANHRASSALRLRADSAAAAEMPLPAAWLQVARALRQPDVSRSLRASASNAASARSRRPRALFGSRDLLLNATAAEQIHKVMRTGWLSGARRAASFKCRCANPKSGSARIISNAPSMAWAAICVGS
mmetsp:Transcript_118117/g.280441  ORF Transcript_118117/g.280441 Transcript_118117/m.280441 type:complete len:215 (-) Transcript_118117:1044-1688(-)